MYKLAMFPQRQQHSVKSQQGIALITALIIVSIVVNVAVWLVYRQQIDIRQTANVLHLEQAYQYADAIETWSSAVLVRDFQKNKQVDSLDEDWAKVLPSLPIKGGSLQARLYDLQGRFNINNILDDKDKIIPRQLAILQGLLRRLNMDAKLAAVITDWLDKNPVITGNDGAEMDYYLGLDPPYLSADTDMVSPSELRLLKDMDQKNVRLLSKQLATLKTQGIPTNINLNTASSEVLVALGLNDSLATDLIEQREDRPFQTVEDFFTQAEVANLIKDRSGLSVNSQWFLLQANIQIDRSRVRLNSILFRDQNGVTRVVQRNYGL